MSVTANVYSLYTIVLKKYVLHIFDTGSELVTHTTTCIITHR
jgi:hypothetical protein